MILITEEIAQQIVSFIKPRPFIDKDIENVIVEKQKAFFINQLLNKSIHENAIDKLKEKLENWFLNSLIQPGETIGIIGAQCIGEKTTQSSLNNFHSAGLDTGSSSQIDNFQLIVTASKVKKKDVRKYFKVSLFLKEKYEDLQLIKNLTVHYLEEVKLSDIIKNIEYKNTKKKLLEIFKDENIEDEDFDDILKFTLDLSKIYTYRITRKHLLSVFSGYKNFCIPYCMLEESATTIDVYCCLKNINKFEFIKKTRETTLTGIEGVKSHIYSRKPDGEWFIECLCNSISVFFSYPNLYDLTRIMCASITDLNNHFGILVAYESIVSNLTEIIPDIDSSHFKVKAMRMTKNGFIEPLTRYTMRTNPSPLTKASFEESFETFLKACRYEEKEKFKSISSTIICGKKPQTGTYQCDVLMDPSFFNIHNNNE